MTFDWMRDIPIWFWAPAVFVMLEIAFAIGLGLGRRRRLRDGDAADDSGQATLGALLALLGLLLAFTYSFALNRFEDRKVALLEETNAISTAYQWADLAAEPGRTYLQSGLLDYARTRVVTREMSNDSEAMQKAIATSLKALSRLWPAAKAAVGEPPHGPVAASTAAAIIKVGDVSTMRLTAGYYRIPAVVLGLMMLVMSIAIILLAYDVGRRDEYSRMRASTFMLVLAALLTVILDFDHPRGGFIQLNQDSLRALIADMERDLQGR